ncbi:hypothetical protein HOO65_011378 [Ceratocystis lukuohia]|uniref:Retrotransposon gag domain-containing protein n=1 Tax=Ceratocystis lukuohia TaxID=2019550 RepID=A0ABR4MUT1_9PEZI
MTQNYSPPPWDVQATMGTEPYTSHGELSIGKLDTSVQSRVQRSKKEPKQFILSWEKEDREQPNENRAIELPTGREPAEFPERNSTSATKKAVATAMAPLTTKQPNAPTSLPAVEIRMYNWIFTDPNEEMDGQFYDTVMTTDSTTMDNSSQTTNATMRPSNPVRLYDHSKPLDYPAFRTILKAQWKYHRSRFPTQEDFIIHCFSHLTGPAAMDIEPWIQGMMASKETADFEAFFTHLDNTFMDPAAAARALEKVTALQAKMSTPAQAHITQVTQLLRAAGGNDWADSIKMRYFTATLPRKVRDALATHQETTYTKYAKVVIVVDIPPLSESTSGKYKM